MENQHNQAIPAEVLADVQKKIDEAAALLQPYIINLTAVQRHDISKMGDKSLAFVSKALELAVQNPALCPGYLDVTAFDIDMTDATGLLVFENSLQQLQQAVDDTAMVAGSEAYQAAPVFYSSAKEAASKNVTGAKAVYEELRVRFPRVKRKQE